MKRHVMEAGDRSNGCTILQKSRHRHKTTELPMPFGRMTGALPRSAYTSRTSLVKGGNRTIRSWGDILQEDLSEASPPDASALLWPSMRFEPHVKIQNFGG